MKAFEMKTLVYDPYVSNEVFEREKVTPVELDHLLKNSDIVSIHIPLSKETKHLIDIKKLELMKPTSFLINTSRGSIINQTALIKALKEKKIAGAALDVLTKEPPLLDNPLLKMENVILTPHVAWYSEFSSLDLLQKAAMEVARTLKGELPINIVNRKQLSKI